VYYFNQELGVTIIQSVCMSLHIKGQFSVKCFAEIHDNWPRLMEVFDTGSGIKSSNYSYALVAVKKLTNLKTNGDHWTCSAPAEKLFFASQFLIQLSIFTTCW